MFRCRSAKPCEVCNNSSTSVRKYSLITHAKAKHVYKGTFMILYMISRDTTCHVEHSFWHLDRSYHEKMLCLNRSNSSKLYQNIISRKDGEQAELAKPEPNGKQHKHDWLCFASFSPKTGIVSKLNTYAAAHKYFASVSELTRGKVWWGIIGVWTIQVCTHKQCFCILTCNATVNFN